MIFVWTMLLVAAAVAPAAALQPRQRPRTPYRIDRASSDPVAADVLAAAIMGAGFHVLERRRLLFIERPNGRGAAILHLPPSRKVGAGPIPMRASDRGLVLGLMTAMAGALGTLRIHTPELGEVVIDPPTDAVSPDAQRAFAAARRPRTFQLGLAERWRRRR